MIVFIDRQHIHLWQMTAPEGAYAPWQERQFARIAHPRHPFARDLFKRMHANEFVQAFLEVGDHGVIQTETELREVLVAQEAKIESPSDMRV